MRRLVFPAPQLSTLSIVEAPGAAVAESAFPVRRVYCVGRNYYEHAVEMEARHSVLALGGGDARAPPFFFQKPSYGAIVDASGGVTLRYPSKTKLVEFECELVVALCGGGASLNHDEARGAVWGFGVGCDLTRRDLQNEAKALRRPWEASKAFDQSAPVGALVPVNTIDAAALAGAEMTLSLDGAVKQTTRLDRMVYDVYETISRLSEEFELAVGDVIFTGTPAGVGAVERGQKVECAVRFQGADVVPPCVFTLA
ncbi:2-keto-4-pentenoate hydratase [Pelagophyceae sp. CCMP2097]|nr:2-keto-4-pentenoate hydratase [Pelagophyceae sp. CCMP2097]|mmetsp:Transcript_4831/g.15334  ORF Transcript_4831/g.15334 Transcript_4831/m.15334 type:complete len:255 (+) Transcript_4831:163-927(+)